MAAKSRKIDTRSIGLDLWAATAKFVTGKENLHYGLWTGLEPVAGNLGAAQEAYTTKLLSFLGDAPLRILDIGGGAGETAKRLEALGHRVEIVVPSRFLAERCRANVGSCTPVHETKFEDFASESGFDACLFSESFQYIPMAVALEKAASLLLPDGFILIADCFRLEAFRSNDEKRRIVGGGWLLSDFREALSERSLEIRREEDVSEDVAPSVELEQEFFNLIGYFIKRADSGLAASHPFARSLATFFFRLIVNRRRRARLAKRLYETSRTAEEFCRFNRYLMLKIAPSSRT
ncbi:MAG: SAM-dependent methyltransferase [Albidovulum sp.]|nr:SAM-dependent methyltransferase [Albidovulum sp.]MDE0303533.1 SAM-dependent methyltransferase [Albidovulum sp.]MDE0531763.1 SAM-dependent methyltransferase [Albidovulum sp.]